MSPTITNTAGTVILLADLRLGYEGIGVDARTIVHDTFAEEPAVTLRPDTLRRGTLTLFFILATDAWAAFTALRAPEVWDLVDDLAPVQMRFVRSGAMRPVQQDNRARWVLEVGFAEVPTT